MTLPCTDFSFSQILLPSSCLKGFMQFVFSCIESTVESTGLQAVRVIDFTSPCNLFPGLSNFNQQLGDLPSVFFLNLFLRESPFWVVTGFLLRFHSTDSSSSKLSFSSLSLSSTPTTFFTFLPQSSSESSSFTFLPQSSHSVSKFAYKLLRRMVKKTNREPIV